MTFGVHGNFSNGNGLYTFVKFNLSELIDLMQYPAAFNLYCYIFFSAIMEDSEKNCVTGQFNVYDVNEILDATMLQNEEELTAQLEFLEDEGYISVDEVFSLNKKRRKLCIKVK